MARLALILSFVFVLGAAVSGCFIIEPIIYSIHYAQLAEELRENHARIIDEYTKAIQSGELSDDELAVAFYDRGTAYADADQYEEAIHDFDEALRLYPRYAAALTGRGKAYRYKSQYDEAIRDFNEALRLNPRHADTWNARGQLYFDTGQYEQAISDFDEALHRDRRHDTARQSRGRAYFYLARFAEAAADLARVVEAAPRSPYDVLWLYLALERNGQDGRAALMQGAEKLNFGKWPGPLVWLYLGQTGASDVLTAAKDEDPRRENVKHCEAYFYLGQLALLDGRNDEARFLFDAAIKSGATNLIEHAAAKAELARLE